MERQPKYKVRPSRETVLFVEINPSELRLIADRLERGGEINRIIGLYGSLNKEGYDIRFMLPSQNHSKGE